MASESACSSEALNDIENLKSWDQLRQHLHKYGQGHCDDGALSEGYSYVVGNLLSNWDGIPTLASLGRSDTEFLKFLLKHIDATLSSDTAAQIAHNAQKSCPAGASELCREVLAAIRRARQQAGGSVPK
jgi:hypothetical protein